LAPAARLRRLERRAAITAALLLAVGAAHGAPADIRRFLGTWTFGIDGQSMATCDGTTYPGSLAGRRVSIYAGTTSDLVFDAGCHCQVQLALTPEGEGAMLTGEQSCDLVLAGNLKSGTINALDLSLSDVGVLTVNLAGNVPGLTFSKVTCLPDFTAAGTLTHTSATPVTCGDPSTVVGVLPAAPEGTTDCPFGAGLEGLQIFMHDESTSNEACSDRTGMHGEGNWLLPDDDRPRQFVCDPHRYTTTLDFCRVDGTQFKPLLSATADPAQGYAVLELGDSCPPGSVEVSMTIDNEDDNQGSEPSMTTGHPGRNLARPDEGATKTVLFFCYFRPTTSVDEAMTGFPDLAIPYAVFHRSAGEQPPWVIAKRWLHSHNEVDHGYQQGPYGSPDPSAIPDFRDIVEMPDGDTTFNLARVR
jgi:hypothetical protein